MRFSGALFSLTEEGASCLRIMPPRTIFILVRGMGLFKDLPILLSDRPATFNQDIKALVASKGVNPEFLAYCLLARKSEILRHVDHAGHGTGRLSTDLLASIPLPLPPLEEQCKIATILKTWDGAIDSLRKLHSANIRRRRWLRNDVFTGKRRFAGSRGEWRKVPLGKVLTEHRLQSTGSEKVFSVSVHKGLINQIDHLGRSFAATDTAHYNLVRPGDIVYTKSPTGEFPLGIIKQSRIAEQVIVSPLYGVFTPVTRDLGVILDAFFESPVTVRNYLHPLVQKGAKNTIAIKNRRFLEGEVYLPLDPSEQSAIADLTNAIGRELTMIDAEIDALTKQKSGLMQKLLTGEWRVRV